MTDLLEPLAQFGVAGLMGALWVWERTMTRKREAQLTEAHDRLLQQGLQLREVMRTVHQNTRAIERFDQTQARLRDLLERIYRDQQHHTT